MLPLQQPLQIFKECGIRNRDALGVVNHAVALGSESCNGKGHRDAVVVIALDLCAMQTLASGNAPACFGLFDLGTHGLGDSS